MTIANAIPLQMLYQHTFSKSPSKSFIFRHSFLVCAAFLHRMTYSLVVCFCIRSVAVDLVFGFNVFFYLLEYFVAQS